MEGTSHLTPGQAIVRNVALTLSKVGSTGGCGALEIIDQVRAERNYGESMRGNSLCGVRVNVSCSGLLL